jgi:hypothetical protein
MYPILLKSANEYGTHPRLVIVSSETHYWVDLPRDVLDSSNVFEYLSTEEYCTKEIMQKRYMVSKRKFLG